MSVSVSAPRLANVSSWVTTLSRLIFSVGALVALVRSAAVPDEMTSVPGWAIVMSMVTSPVPSSCAIALTLDSSPVVVRTRPSPIAASVICGNDTSRSSSGVSIVRTTSFRTRLSPVSWREPSVTV